MVRILIADDHPEMLRMVRQILQQEEGWEICGEAIDGEQAVSKAIELKPDVIILDLAMPKCNGLRAARRICEQEPSSRVLLFTALAVDQRLVDQARSAGIRAVLNKLSANLLPCAVRVLLQGQVGTFFALTRVKGVSEPGKLRQRLRP
jgi:two-component system, NarL family, response regulator LiaR